MSKKFLTFNLLIFLILLILGSVIHLMYGSCQTSKYHYMCQAYWMPDYLPKWMIKVEIYPEGNIVHNYHADKWNTWHRNGVKSGESLSELKDGKVITKYTGWYENGGKLIEFEEKDARRNGRLTEWDDKGNKVTEWEFKDGVLIKDYLENDRSGLKNDGTGVK